MNDDGCDSACQVEACWTCDGLSPTACYIGPENTIGILNATMDRDNGRVVIRFNNSIVLQPGFDIYAAISVDVYGPMVPYNMSWYLYNSDAWFDGVGTDNFEILLNWMETQLYGNGSETL